MVIVEAGLIVGSVVMLSLLYTTFLRRMVKTSSEERKASDRKYYHKETPETN